MHASTPHAALERAGYPAEAGFAATIADERGVSLLGRRDEYDRLRDAGANDLAWGRLYEGHVNAMQLIARLGTPEQRLRAERDATRGLLFGVWNTEASDGVRARRTDDGRIVLSGRKTFASGAGRVARAIISAAWSEGPAQLTIVPMDAVETAIDESFWKPFGMEASDSFAVDFSGVTLSDDDHARRPRCVPRVAVVHGRRVALRCGADRRCRTAS